MSPIAQWRVFFVGDWLRRERTAAPSASIASLVAVQSIQGVVTLWPETGLRP